MKKVKCARRGELASTNSLSHAKHGPIGKRMGTVRLRIFSISRYINVHITLHYITLHYSDPKVQNLVKIAVTIFASQGQEYNYADQGEI